MGKQEKPSEMSLEELLEAEKTRPPLTEEEKQEQISALALAEARNDGDYVSTEEDMDATVRMVRATEVGRQP